MTTLVVTLLIDVCPEAATYPDSGKTFLKLCQLTCEKCGISGPGPAVVTSQTGEMVRIVNWVQEAWIELQQKSRDWDWMRGEFCLSTSANVQEYTPANASLTDFSRWHPDTLRSYKSSLGVADQQWLVEWRYDIFRDTYIYAGQATGRPFVFAVRPRDKALLFGNIPDDVYEIRGEYQKAARPFLLGTEIPSLPEEFHMLIVYGAMKKYAFYENAPEVAVAADEMYTRMLNRLMTEQAPEYSLGCSLA
jgi:hypothetical protein